MTTTYTRLTITFTKSPNGNVSCFALQALANFNPQGTAGKNIPTKNEITYASVKLINKSVHLPVI